MSKAAWQTVIAPAAKKDSPSAVRRIAVDGGWLYQVEHHVETSDGRTLDWVEWHAPVFVPSHGDGQ